MTEQMPSAASLPTTTFLVTTSFWMLLDKIDVLFSNDVYAGIAWKNEKERRCIITKCGAFPVFWKRDYNRP